MILREIAESDYHYTAEQVAKWTMYQYKQYVCDKSLLRNRRTFGSWAEAKAEADRIRKRKGRS